IFQLRRTPAKLGKGVTKVPGHAAADIEVRISALQAGKKAVIRLGGVGNEILEVAGIIDGVRPDEVEGGVKSAPAVYPHAGLQRMVGGTRRGFLLVHVIQSGVRSPGNVRTRIKPGDGT